MPLGEREESAGGVLPILGETVGAAKPWSARMLTAVQKLSRPETSEGEYYLAWALLKQEPAQTEEARQHLERSAAMDPKATRALLGIGQLARRATIGRGAMTALEEALRRDDRLGAAHYRLAQLYRAAGEPERSRAHLRRFEEVAREVICVRIESL